MLIIRRIETIPAKRLLEDLAFRDGSPTEASPTELDGMYSSVTIKQLNKMLDGQRILNTGLDTARAFGLQDDLILKQAESRYNKHHPNDQRVFHYVEDVPLKQMQFEVDHVLKSIKLNNKKSWKEAADANPVQRKLMDMGEDGEESTTIQENEMLLDTDVNETLNIDDMEKHKTRASYIIKRLHDRSKTVGFHLMSAAIAYADIRRKNWSTAVPRSYYNNPDIALYLMHANGQPGLQVVENKHQGQEFSKWFTGKYGTDEYYEMMVELYYICSEVGIPLWREDPRDYNESSVKGIVTTYLEKNRTYVERLRAHINQATHKTILDLDMGAYTKTNASRKKPKMDLIERIYITVEAYNSRAYGEHRSVPRRQFDESMGNYVKDMVHIAIESLQTLKMETPNQDLKYAYFQDGFLMRGDTDFVTINIGSIRYGDPEGVNTIGLIHQSGTLVRVSDTGNYVIYADMSDLNLELIMHVGDLERGVKPTPNYKDLWREVN